MKKFTLIILVILTGIFSSQTLISQNLVQNGDLELWDDAATPTNWDKAESIEQSTEMVHDGTYSAKHISASGTQDFQQQVMGITPGGNYTITYYYYDNDPMARTRMWSYWLDDTGSTLDDNVEELRPADYSIDLAEWVKYEVTLTAPATAVAFRYEVRVYKQDDQTGGGVFYDGFSITPAGSEPEPTNYPTDFTATANGLNIDLTWTDATGDVTPSGYLIIAEILPVKYDTPVDGTPVDDDLDFSDNVASVNVPYGQQSYTFNNLMGGSIYNFVIFPYSNGGANIDYKTDGTVPEANAETSASVIILAADFNEDWNNWTAVSVVGDQLWDRDLNYGVDNTPCAKMTGYVSASNENEDWLISPALDLSMYINEVFTFFTAKNYNGPQLEVMYSTNYAGGDNPNDSDWTSISAELCTGDWEWTNSGDIDLSGIDSEACYIAFKYLSTPDASATWEVDNITIIGEYEVGINNIIENRVNIYPNPATNFISVSTSVNSGVIEIMSLTGQVVKSASLNNNDQIINVSNISKGIYFARIKSDKNNIVLTTKVIIQ